VGLFPEDKPPEYMLPWWPEDAHVTLSHLGKGSKNLTNINHICEAVETTRFQYGRVGTEITGLGMFWRRVPTLVALVNSPGVIYMRELLISELRVRGLAIETRFGFIPHVTLNPIGTIHDLLETRLGTPGEFDTQLTGKKMSSASPFKLDFPQLSIVCGDARVSV
jgi:2'-5' RNA ligase